MTVCVMCCQGFLREDHLDDRWAQATGDTVKGTQGGDTDTDSHHTQSHTHIERDTYGNHTNYTVE